MGQVFGGVGLGVGVVNLWWCWRGAKTLPTLTTEFFPQRNFFIAVWALNLLFCPTLLAKCDPFTVIIIANRTFHRITQSQKSRIYGDASTLLKQLDGYYFLIMLEVFIIGKNGYIDSFRHSTNQKVNMGTLNSLFSAFVV